MFLRKIGSIIRGDSTPFQIATACVIGAMLGFVPGILRAPGITLTLILMLILLNANLPLSVLIGVFARLASLALMPLSFVVGRGLLDGPLQGLFKAMINAPGLALFGFEYYVATGGLVLGLIFGGLSAYLLARSIHGFRKKMADLEESSDKYKDLIARKSVKIFLWLFVGGGHGKKTYQDILAKKVGNPVRPLGVVFVIVMIAMLSVIYMFTHDAIVVMALNHALERANGATVDIEGAEVDLKEGRMTINGLAAANPSRLDTDLFRASKLQADISTNDLLRKRLHLEKVLISDASYGKKRDIPGRLLFETAPPERTPPEEEPAGEGEFDIEEIFTKTEDLKEKYKELRRWLDKLSGPAEGESPKDESLAERLQREIGELGYMNVIASHLIEGAPTLHVSEFVVEKLDAPSIIGESMKITGSHLSTHPSLLPEPPKIDIETESKIAGFNMNLKELSDPKALNHLDLNWQGLKIDDLVRDLSFADKIPFSGGTLDVKATGDWSFGKKLSIPVGLTIRQAKIQVPELGEMTLDEFPLKFEVAGTVKKPRVKFDTAQLTELIKEQGTKMLKAKLAQERDKLVDKGKEKIDELTGKLQDKLGDKLKGETGQKISDSLGGKGDEISEKGGDLIKGLFGTEKKEEKPEPEKDTPGEPSEEPKPDEKKESPKDLIKGLFGK